MDFLIKTYPDGALTQYLSNELKPGMEMSFKGPIPKHRQSSHIETVTKLIPWDHLNAYRMESK